MGKKVTTKKEEVIDEKPDNYFDEKQIKELSKEINEYPVVEMTLNDKIESLKTMVEMSLDTAKEINKDLGNVHFEQVEVNLRKCSLSLKQF